MRRTALAVPLLALVLAACGGREEGTTSDAGAGSRPLSGSAGADVGAGSGMAEAGADPAAPPAAAPDRARVAPVERAVVRTAALVVEVPDLRVAADRARAAALGAGGELAAEQSALGEDEARAVLTLRVPGAKLDATVGGLAALGRERQREVSTEDVTEQLVDLDARVATQRASVARVRTLLERASGIGDVVKIEGELAKREAELESLTSRMAAVEGRVALSTVTLTLVSTGSTPADEQVGFSGGLERGWGAFTATARFVAAATGALLPFLPLLLLAAWAARRWARRGALALAPQAESRA